MRTHVQHLYHGDFRNRLYRERWNYLIEAQFDPATDIELDETGLWRWTASAMELKRQIVADVARYFVLRKEDD